jgi:hypothetical protein
VFDYWIHVPWFLLTRREGEARRRKERGEGRRDDSEKEE